MYFSPARRQMSKYQIGSEDVGPRSYQWLQYYYKTTHLHQTDPDDIHKSVQHCAMQQCLVCPVQSGEITTLTFTLSAMQIPASLAQRPTRRLSDCLGLIIYWKISKLSFCNATEGVQCTYIIHTYTLSHVNEAFRGQSRSSTQPPITVIIWLWHT